MEIYSPPWISSSTAFTGLIIFFIIIIHIYKKILMEPRRIRRKLHMQGIKGPSPSSFLYGNLPEMQQIELKIKMMKMRTKTKTKEMGSIHDLVAHDYSSIMFPYLEHWRKIYGPVFTYSTGWKQHLYINDPELVKEMNQTVTLGLGKPPSVTKNFKSIFGSGIVRSNGHAWAYQRKIVAPEFYMDKVKRMVGLMVDSALPLVRKWEESIEGEGGMEADITVDEDLRGFSADVIARTCFGSSYIKGQEIFSKLRCLQNALTEKNFLFKATKFGFSLNKNKRISNLEREIETLIWETVKARQRQYGSGECSVEKDLMQSLLEEAVNNESSSNNIAGKVSAKRFMVDNCKGIYFSGQDTTATVASWCLMLLALHPHWQSRIREEVSQFCSHGLPDACSLSNLKTVTMVIQEALRLYPPSAFVAREALEEVQIGRVKVPKGVCIWNSIPALHRDPNIWGPDANEFKPQRFSHGVSKACKYPQAYIPFGLGTRLCLGRNFAMAELKVVISILVSRFCFSLSPSYTHSPIFRMTVQPQHGVSIIIRNV